MNPTLAAIVMSCLLASGPAPESSVGQPAYCLDDVVVGPLESLCAAAGGHLPGD